MAKKPSIEWSTLVVPSEPSERAVFPTRGRTVTVSVFAEQISKRDRFLVEPDYEGEASARVPYDPGDAVTLAALLKKTTSLMPLGEWLSLETWRIQPGSPKVRKRVYSVPIIGGPAAARRLARRCGDQETLDLWKERDQIWYGIAHGIGKDRNFRLVLLPCQDQSSELREFFRP